MTPEETYTVSEQKVEGQKSLYRIDKPGMPTYFAKSWQEAGRELAHLDAEDESITFTDLKDPAGRHMILAFFHANRVLSRPKSSGLEKAIRK